MDVNPEGAVKARDKAEQILLENNIGQKLIMRSILMIEEILMLVYDKSGGENVAGECVITVSPEEVSVIIRNNGEELDVKDDGEWLSLIYEAMFCRHLSVTGRREKSKST